MAKLTPVKSQGTFANAESRLRVMKSEKLWTHVSFTPEIQIYYVGGCSSIPPIKLDFYEQN